MLTIERTERTSSRATTAQEYFWYLRRADPEPSSYTLGLALRLEGPLDRAALRRAAEATVARHDVFRTALREVGGELLQHVLPDAPRFELEVDEARLGAPEAERAAAIDRAMAELDALEPATGRTIRARLLAFAPDHHVLTLRIDHGFADGASVFMLQREILRQYARGSDAAGDRAPPVQYLDYAAALDRFARSPAGLARQAWWGARLSGARPLALPFDLPLDLPRAEVDARRDAAPLGIVPEPMYPNYSIEIPAALRQHITRVSLEEATSAAVVYLAAYLWLLRECSGQDDLAIENVYNPRSDHGVELVQGALATFTIMRCELAACRTFRDVIRTAGGVVAEAYRQSPIADYFKAVAPALRGTCFNYLPEVFVRRTTTIPGLLATRAPWSAPCFRRHWHLMCFVVDSSRHGMLHLTGNSRLWRQETIHRLAHRYVEILERELAPA